MDQFDQWFDRSDIRNIFICRRFQAIDRLKNKGSFLTGYPYFLSNVAKWFLSCPASSIKRMITSCSAEV